MTSKIKKKVRKLHTYRGQGAGTSRHGVYGVHALRDDGLEVHIPMKRWRKLEAEGRTS